MMSNSILTEARTRDQVALCKDILFAFRPNLNESDYIDLIMDMMLDEAFRLVYVVDTGIKKAVAFTGYRTMHTLRTGRMIYIDDLYCDPDYRRKGYAGMLLDYVDDEATQSGVSSIHLDSGYSLHTAHRLYLNKGYFLACNHFAKDKAPANLQTP